MCCRVGVCDPAHGPVNGTGSKGPDNEALPLCRDHHEYQAEIGHERFAQLYGFPFSDWRTEAAAHYALYLIWKEGTCND